MLPAGGFIPMARTQPALDLDALIGGFKPLFKALDPEKVNNIATVAGHGASRARAAPSTTSCDQTAQLTSTLADRDQAIGEVITNLNTVLATTVKHQKEFDQTVNNFEVLITGLKNRADPLADAVADISNAAGTLGRSARRQPSAAAGDHHASSRPSSSRWSTSRRSWTSC